MALQKKLMNKYLPVLIIMLNYCFTNTSCSRCDYYSKIHGECKFKVMILKTLIELSFDKLIPECNFRCDLCDLVGEQSGTIVCSISHMFDKCISEK